MVPYRPISNYRPGAFDPLSARVSEAITLGPVTLHGPAPTLIPGPSTTATTTTTNHHHTSLLLPVLPTNLSHMGQAASAVKTSCLTLQIWSTNIPYSVATDHRHSATLGLTAVLF